MKNIILGEPMLHKKALYGVLSFKLDYLYSPPGVLVRSSDNRVLKTECSFS